MRFFVVVLLSVAQCEHTRAMYSSNFDVSFSNFEPVVIVGYIPMVSIGILIFVSFFSVFFPLLAKFKNLSVFICSFRIDMDTRHC